MTRTTKLFLIAAVILLIGLVTFLAGRLFSDNPESEKTNSRSSFFFPGEGGNGGATSGEISEAMDPKLKEAAEARLKSLIAEPVVGAALSKEEDGILYYKRSGGNAFRRDLEGQNEKRITQLTVIGLTEVLWSPLREFAIVSYFQDGQIKRFIQTIATSTTALLPANTTSVSWSPDGKQIAYTELSSNGLRVMTAAPTGRSARAIYSSLIPDLRVQWKTNNSTLLTTVPSYSVEGFIELVPIGGNSQQIIERRGMQSLPTASKDVIAISSTNESGTYREVELINGRGQLIVTSNAKTSVEKCTWNKAGTTLYCAVPRGNYSSLPDAWHQGEISFNDRIVMINATTGETSPLADTELDAIELFLNTPETNIYFINKKDASLWKFKLN